MQLQDLALSATAQRARALGASLAPPCACYRASPLQPASVVSPSCEVCCVNQIRHLSYEYFDRCAQHTMVVEHGRQVVSDFLLESARPFSTLNPKPQGVFACLRVRRMA